MTQDQITKLVTQLGISISYDHCIRIFNPKTNSTAICTFTNKFRTYAIFETFEKFKNELLNYIISFDFGCNPRIENVYLSCKTFEEAMIKYDLSIFK